MIGPWLGFAEQPTNPPTGEVDMDTSSYDEDVTVGSEVNAVVMVLLPWSIAVLMHVGIVLLALFVTWSTITQVDDEEIIIPSARLSATPGAPLTMKTTTKQLTRKTSSTSRSLSRSKSQSQSTLTSPTSSQTSLVGLAGAAPSAKSNPFGKVIRPAGDFSASMYGTGGNAKKLAYLIDASGSLIDTLQFVMLELKRSINELKEAQSFTVIFFQGDDAVEVPPRGLKKATNENKMKVVRWIDPRAGNIVAAGQSNPVSALKLALRYKPQLMFILSDNITGEGRYEVDQRRLIYEIAQANTAGTKINTIQFLYKDKIAEFSKATLEIIADQSGGQYKFLDARELGIQ